jgi:hypothetical protein
MADATALSNLVWKLIDIRQKIEKARKKAKVLNKFDKDLDSLRKIAEKLATDDGGFGDVGNYGMYGNKGVNLISARMASDSYRKLLAAALHVALLADMFKDQNATWFIENFTEASVGLTGKNQEGLDFLQEMQASFADLQQLTIVIDNIGMAMKIEDVVDEDLDRRIANGFVSHDVTRIDMSTRTTLSVSSERIDKAIALLQMM